MKEYFAAKKHFIPTLIVSGFLMFIAGIIVNNIGTSKIAEAELANQSNNMIHTDGSHLFEDYIANLGVIMLYFGLAMIFIAGIWLLYFLFTMNSKAGQKNTDKTVNISNAE